MQNVSLSLKEKRARKSGQTSEIQETGGKFIRKSGVRAGKT